MMAKLWTKHNLFQKIRALKYIFFVVAAVISLFVPSAIVLSAVGLGFSYFWSILLLGGAVLGTMGVFSKTWVGEYVGLPPLIACLLMYALGCFLDFPHFTFGRLFLGFIFLAFTASSLARWWDVKFQKRVAVYEKRVKDGKPGL